MGRQEEYRILSMRPFLKSVRVRPQAMEECSKDPVVCAGGPSPSLLGMGPDWSPATIQEGENRGCAPLYGYPALSTGLGSPVKLRIRENTRHLFFRRPAGILKDVFPQIPLARGRELDLPVHPPA